MGTTRWVAGVLLGLALTLLGAPALADLGGDGGAAVYTVRLDGPVSPVSATTVLDALTAAEDGGATALLVEIDTPGGLVASTREIVENLLGARVPVVTYVTPPGARAASAGTFITMSGHVAAMAPATTIGAATPVTLGGDEAGDKVVNDLAAFAEAIATQRGRDMTFARAAVEQGRSVTADTALDEGVVDLIADDRTSLLNGVDGTDVTLADGRTVTLATAGAPVREVEPGPIRGLLEVLVDPNLTFVLLGLGTLALLLEFAAPGIGAGGVTGVILLLLAGFSLSLLPTTLTGIGLLLLAVGLFIAELFVPGTGVMAAGGSISLVLAGLFLFDDATGVAISGVVLIPIAAVVLAGSVALAISVRNAQARPRRLDDDQLLDRVVEVAAADHDRGQVLVDGERWRVRTDDPPLERGMRVRILEREGLTLLVEPDEEIGWT